MTTIWLCGALTIASAQGAKARDKERYLGYVGEARQWIARKEFERAAKTAQYAISFAEEKEFNSYLATTALGEALFRMKDYEGASMALLVIRPGKNGALDGMLVVACSRANHRTGGFNGMGQHYMNMPKDSPELLGMPNPLGTGLEANGWIIIAKNETGAIGEDDAKQATALAPDSMTAWWVLGQRQFEQKKYKEAKIAFDRVVSGKVGGLAKLAKAKAEECTKLLKSGGR